MSETRGKFNLEGFYRALEAVRQTRKLNWKQVAGETGVAASTLTRMSQGKRPDVDTLAALSDWSGLNPVDYMPIAESDRQRDTLAMVSTCFSNDPNLDKEAAEAIDLMVKTVYEQFRKK